MCVVSMIGDHYSDKWRQQEYADMLKRLQDTPVNPSPFFAHPTVSIDEFNALKKEVEEMKNLLKKALKTAKQQ